MPLQHCLGLYDQGKIAPAAEPSACKYPKEPVNGFEVGSRLPALEHQQLLLQAQVLRDQERFRLQCSQNGP
jgi:hypothetical protein